MPTFPSHLRQLGNLKPTNLLDTAKKVLMLAIDMFREVLMLAIDIVFEKRKLHQHGVRSVEEHARKDGRGNGCNGHDIEARLRRT